MEFYLLADDGVVENIYVAEVPLPKSALVDKSFRVEIGQNYYAGAARSKRDGMLASSDWTQLADSPISDEKKAEWANYRQALRDITEADGFPSNFEWPRSP